MQRVPRILLGGLAVFIILSVIAFSAYDLVAFQSRRGEIVALIANASLVERNPSQTLRRLVLTEDGDLLAVDAARILIEELDVPWVMHSSLGWHATGALWTWLVRLHLSEDQQIAIICTRSYVVRGARGFEAAANGIFQMPLVQLDEEQLAALVVIRRWPSRWSQPGYRQELTRARDALIRRTHLAKPHT